MVEIGENGIFRKKLEIDSTESKIVQFGLDFGRNQISKWRENFERKNRDFR